MTRPFRFKPGRQGSVFVMTLAILIVLASLALVLSRSMRVEAQAAVNHVAQLQTQSITDGAIQYLRTTLDGNDGALPEDGSLQAQAVLVGSGYYWLIKRDYEMPTGGQALGITDEEGKLNINAVDLEVLAQLPGMTQELAAGIVDWRDDNEETEAGGGESTYYLSLASPYQAKNDLFETVGELLLVKDITPQVFWGEDANANGLLDDNENDGDTSTPADNADGQLDRGLAAYVTVYNSQAVLDQEGQTRINVNRGNQLNSVLAEVVPTSRLSQVIDQVRRERPFQNLIDFYYRSGLLQAEFERIEDRLTTGGSQSRAQVNINTAPRQVLAALPGMTESDVQSVIDYRQSTGQVDSLSDIITMLPREKAIAIGGMVKTKSYRYSADIVAVDGRGRAFTRTQVVIDAQVSPPRVIYRRDLTNLGWPLDAQILEDLRAGKSIDGQQSSGSLLTGVR